MSNYPLQREIRSEAPTWSTLDDEKNEVWIETTSHSIPNDWSLQTVENSCSLYKMTGHTKEWDL